MKILDIDIKKIKAITPRAVHTIYFGGERLRQIRVYYNRLGEPIVAKVMYSEPRKK